MLRTAFIGNENTFDEKVCEFLSENTDLSLIIWTDKMAWANDGPGRGRRIIRRFIDRGRRHGPLRACNEFLYYLLYRQFLAADESRKINDAVKSVHPSPKVPISSIRQVRPDNIKSPELLAAIHEAHLDALFAMCIDVYLPDSIFNAPTLGTFLWHEGITPEYRGVYSPFWALLNNDFDNLGYTFLKMNKKLDAGQIYMQGRPSGIDPHRDWHSFIGHKAVLDSFPDVKRILAELDDGTAKPVDRSGAADGYYSYPTATGLIKIALRRLFAKQNGITEFAGNSPNQ